MSRLEPNLNPWWAVAYRRTNQWLRRNVAYRHGMPWRRRWEDRWQYLASLHGRTAWEDIPAADRAEWVRCVWKIGLGPIHQFTPAQRREMVRLTELMLAEIRTEEGKG